MRATVPPARATGQALAQKTGFPRPPARRGPDSAVFPRNVKTFGGNYVERRNFDGFFHVVENSFPRRGKPGALHIGKSAP